MLARHTSMIHAKCPVNDGWDYYEVVVESGQIVKVEDIDAALAEVRGAQRYQEELAAHLSSRLPGCRVTLTGRHGTFSSTVTCG